MLIIVNYIDETLQEEATRIINKLCEGERCVSIDLAGKLEAFSKPVQSLRFAELKKMFELEIPALEANVALDGFELRSAMSCLDDFQKDFLQKQMDALGHVTANLVRESALDSSDPFSFDYKVGKEFFVDFENKLNPLVKKLEEAPFYKLLKGIDAYGYYLGTCDLNDPPTKVIVFPGGAGQKISYEEYTNWVLSSIPLKTIEANKMKTLEAEGEKFAFVRQHHPIELIAKKIVKKAK